MASYDVYDAIQTAHPELMICVAGLEPADHDELVDIIENYQADWDSGKTFIPDMMTMFDPSAKRNPEQDAAEFDACVNQASGAVLAAYLNKKLADVSRNAICATLNTLAALDGNNGKLKVAGFELRLDEIAAKWNKAHPMDKPLAMRVDF